MNKNKSKNEAVFVQSVEYRKNQKKMKKSIAICFFSGIMVLYQASGEATPRPPKARACQASKAQKIFYIEKRKRQW